MNPRRITRKFGSLATAGLSYCPTCTKPRMRNDEHLYDWHDIASEDAASNLQFMKWEDAILSSLAAATGKNESARQRGVPAARIPQSPTSLLYG